MAFLAEKHIEMSDEGLCGRGCLNIDIVDVGEVVGLVERVRRASFCETMALWGNRCALFDEHYDILVASMEAVGLSAYLLPDRQAMRRRVEVLCQKNHYPAFSLVDVSVAEVGAGVEYYITQRKLGGNPFVARQENVFLYVFQECTFGCSPVDWVKCYDPQRAYLEREVAKKKREENETFGACLMDRDGMLLGSTIGKVFAVVGEEVVYVGWRFGGGRDAIEERVVGAAEKAGFRTSECRGIDFRAVDECFVVGATFGLRAVRGIIGSSARRVFDNEKVKKIEKVLYESLV